MQTRSSLNNRRRLSCLLGITALILGSVITGCTPSGSSDETKDRTITHSQANELVTSAQRAAPPVTLPGYAEQWRDGDIREPAIAKVQTISDQAPPHLAILLDADANQRIPGNIDQLLPPLTDDNDIALVYQLLLNRQENETIRHEAANLLRRSKAPLTGDILLRVLKDPTESERFRAFAAQHLGLLFAEQNTTDHDSLATVLTLAMNEDPAEGVRRESFSALLKAGYSPAVERSADLTDPSLDGFRDLAIHYALQNNLRESSIDAIRVLIDNEDPATQIAAINVLGRWQDSASRERIAAIGHKAAGNLQRACELALQRIDQKK